MQSSKLCGGTGSEKEIFACGNAYFAIVLALTAAIGIFGGTASGAVRSAQVDTITMDAEMPDDEVEVEPSARKTQQDKGRWIDKMGIGDDVNSLLLIINNLDTETDTVKTTKDRYLQREGCPREETASRELETSLPLENGYRLAGKFFGQLLCFRWTG